MAEQIVATLDEILHITAPLGVDQAAVSEFPAEFSVTQLAAEFDSFIDGLTGHSPGYDGMNEVLRRRPRDSEYPASELTGNIGEREARRTVKIDADYGVTNHPIAEYVIGKTGPVRRAILEAPYLLEKDEDPSSVAFTFESWRFGTSYDETERDPGLYWKVQRTNIASGGIVLDENSGKGCMMEEGAHPMEHTVNLTPEKAVIFKVGIEALKSFNALSPLSLED